MKIKTKIKKTSSSTRKHRQDRVAKLKRVFQLAIRMFNWGEIDIHYESKRYGVTTRSIQRDLAFLKLAGVTHTTYGHGIYKFTANDRVNFRNV